MARRNAGILDSIRRGDRVTIVNRFGQQRTGRAVMRGPHGWVLNMGGRYGTPAVATEANIVKVGSRRNAGPRSVRKSKKAFRKSRAAHLSMTYGLGLKAAAKRARKIKYPNRGNLQGYRVATKGGRWKYFTTLAEANAYANRIFQKTGVFAAIEHTKANPPRVKGRKVKGGRSVTLRNFTGTIVRKSDGTVNILGRGRRR